MNPCVAILQRELGRRYFLTKSLTELAKRGQSDLSTFDHFRMKEEIEFVFLFDCDGMERLLTGGKDMHEYFDFAVQGTTSFGGQGRRIYEAN